LVFISHPFKEVYQLVYRNPGGPCRPRGISIWLPLIIE